MGLLDIIFYFSYWFLCAAAHKNQCLNFLALDNLLEMYSPLSLISHPPRCPKLDNDSLLSLSSLSTSLGLQMALLSHCYKDTNRNDRRGANKRNARERDSSLAFYYNTENNYIVCKTAARISTSTVSRSEKADI